MNSQKLTRKPKGTLIIIGGHEDKEGDCDILTEVAKRANRNRHLAIITVATHLPEAVAADYEPLFKKLGASNVHWVDIRTRDEAFDEEKAALCAKASVIFFTGGDQLRITSQLGDSPIYRCMRDVYQEGGTIVGTSAGAAAMSETMLIAGTSDKSTDPLSIDMAPGLGLISDVVIDSHFAERGRMGRLLGAVARNPRILGLGIDEDTAVIVSPDGTFEVMGSGAVYVVDGAAVSYSNLSEKNIGGILTAFDVRLHVLGADFCFDLNQRRPLRHGEVVEALPVSDEH